MRAADDGGADFLEERNVFVEVRLGNRPAFVEAVLMLVHAVQMIRLAVQEKSLVRVNGIITQADLLLDGINHHGRKVCLHISKQNFFCHRVHLAQFHNGLVKIRVLAAVPQMRLRHGDAQGVRRGVAVGERDFLLRAGDAVAVGVKHRRRQRARLAFLVGAGDLRRHVQHGLGLIDARLQPLDAG